MTLVYVTGAYGRVYHRPEIAEADWAEGKDFKIVRGPYTSIRDSAALVEDGFTSVVILNSQTGKPVCRVDLKP